MTTSFRSPERLERHLRWIDAWKTRRDSAALQRLIGDYMPMFHAEIARAMRGRTLQESHRDDLVQECAQAMIVALDGLDPNRAQYLTPYLARHIRGVVRRYVLDFRAPCRLGTSSDDRKAYYAAQRLRVDRLTQGQEQMTHQDVAAVARDSATSMAVAQRAVMAMQSGAIDLEEVEVACSAPDGLEQLAEKDARTKAMAAFERLVADLPERTRAIVCGTMLTHKSEGAVARLAERYSLTPRRVRQIQGEGLQALRDKMEAEGLTAECIF